MDFKAKELNVEEQLHVDAEKNSFSPLADFELALVGGGGGDVIFA